MNQLTQIDDSFTNSSERGLSNVVHVAKKLGTPKVRDRRSPKTTGVLRSRFYDRRSRLIDTIVRILRSNHRTQVDGICNHDTLLRELFAWGCTVFLDPRLLWPLAAD